MSYVLKRKIRKYRKKFVMPVLTSNGTMGGSTFAVNCSTPKTSVYEMFNTGADGTKGVDTSPNAAPQWVSFYNPVPLKVTKLRIGQIKDTTQAQHYYITAYKIQVSDDNQTWTDVYSGTGSKPAVTLTANIADSGYHKYYRVYVTSAPYYSGYPRVFFFGIDFDAEAEDAVFYDDIVKSYVVKQKVRKYYKYVSQPWTQPIITSAGTLGGSTFAVSASSTLSGHNVINPFNGQNNWWCSGTGGYPHYYIFYNPNKLLIEKLLINVYCDNGAFKTYNIQTSMDGNSYTTVLAGDTGLTLTNAPTNLTIDLSNIAQENRIGKYWKINFLSPVNTKATIADIGRTIITAQEISKALEVSSTDDWDYYEESTESYVIGRK